MPSVLARKIFATLFYFANILCLEMVQKLYCNKDYRISFNLPTFVTAHTYCASRNTGVSCGWCLLIQGYLLRGLKLCGGSRNYKVLLVSKEKIEGNHAFFRDIKGSLWNKTHNIALYFTACLPPIFSLDSYSLCLSLLFLHSLKPRKNSSILVGTALKLLQSTYFSRRFPAPAPLSSLDTLFRSCSLVFTNLNGDSSIEAYQSR